MFPFLPLSFQTANCTFQNSQLIYLIQGETWCPLCGKSVIVDSILTPWNRAVMLTALSIGAITQLSEPQHCLSSVSVHWPVLFTQTYQSYGQTPLRIFATLIAPSACMHLCPYALMLYFVSCPYCALSLKNEIQSSTDMLGLVHDLWLSRVIQFWNPP